MQASFWLYPSPGPGSPVQLSLGECVTSYDERPEVLAADAVAMTGAVQRSLGLSRKRITLTLELMAGGPDLAARLLALENHLQRGGRCAFSADQDRAWAAFLTSPYTAGATSLSPGVPPWSSMVGAGIALNGGDRLRLRSGFPEGTEEKVEIDAWNGASPIQLSTSTPPLFSPTEPVLVSWEWFWPVLLRPADQLNRAITVVEIGNVWSLAIELATDDASTWAANQEGVVLNSGNGSGGRTLETLLDTDGVATLSDGAVYAPDPLLTNLTGR